MPAGYEDPRHDQYTPEDEDDNRPRRRSSVSFAQRDDPNSRRRGSNLSIVSGYTQMDDLDMEHDPEQDDLEDPYDDFIDDEYLDEPEEPKVDAQEAGSKRRGSRIKLS
jgi:hypothetical protein